MYENYYGQERTIKTIHFGEIISTDDGFPQIQVTAEGDDHVYYLSPFRGYKFQVSGDDHGDGDYGSTEVFGLGSIKSMFREGPSNIGGNVETRKYFLSMAAYATLQNFCYYQNIHCRDSFYFIEQDIFYGFWRDDSNEHEKELARFDEFIDKCYEWI